MKVYCISDIHGCLTEFEIALSMVLEHLDKDDAKLVLLGDYIHGGADNREVLDRIISLQGKYGPDRVIALLGNHEELVLEGTSSINHMTNNVDKDQDDDMYISWIGSLPRYHVEGNTIFVHAGIDEEAADMWELGTGDHIFTMKFPVETGRIEGLSMKVVAGHVGTAEIAGNSKYHDIYYDGESHYYIDGTVLDSGFIPVLMVDTETDKYYRVTQSGLWLVLPYDSDK